MWRLTFFFFLLLNCVCAGPITTLRMANGSMVRSEVMHADSQFLYCRKVTDRNMKFRYALEDAPQSLRRRVEYLLEKGELSPPVDVQPAPVVPKEAPASLWEYKDSYISNSKMRVRRLYQVGSCNYPGKPSINFRHSDRYDAYVYFDRRICGARKWLITIEVDGEPVLREGWDVSTSGSSVFPLGPLLFRDRLKGHQSLRISTEDYRGEKLVVDFKLSGFEDGLQKLEAGLDL